MYGSRRQGTDAPVGSRKLGVLGNNSMADYRYWGRSYASYTQRSSETTWLRIYASPVNVDMKLQVERNRLPELL